jgi:hypothetical protein
MNNDASPPLMRGIVKLSGGKVYRDGAYVNQFAPIPCL